MFITVLIRAHQLSIPPAKYKSSSYTHAQARTHAHTHTHTHTTSFKLILIWYSHLLLLFQVGFSFEVNAPKPCRHFTCYLWVQHFPPIPLSLTSTRQRYLVTCTDHEDRQTQFYQTSIYFFIEPSTFLSTIISNTLITLPFVSATKFRTHIKQQNYSLVRRTNSACTKYIINTAKFSVHHTCHHQIFFIAVIVKLSNGPLHEKWVGSEWSTCTF
jgi:hypothetical protein